MTVRPKAATLARFEALESRRLLATINVTDFGAIPNDGADDSRSIQRAFNSAAPGDTVAFAAGEFTIAGTLTLRSNSQYLGSNTTLKWSAGIGTADMAFGRRVNNVTIKGFIFDGAGVKLEGTSGINFTDNTVQNVTSGSAYFGNGVTAIDISNVNVLRNKFLNIGHRGLMVFSVTESRFEDNLFDGCYQAMHFNNFSPSRNVSFSYNTIRGSKRHGIEMQSYGDTDNWIVEGNLIEKWADGRPGWPSHMAISFAMGNTVNNPDGTIRPIRSNGHILRGNVVIADGAIPTQIAGGVPKTYFTAFEVMGNGTIVENNYGEGWGWYQLIGRADANWITRNNTWLGTALIPAIPGIGTEAGREIVPNDWQGGPAQNNGNYVGRVGDRPRPVAGVRGGTPTPTPFPNPNPNPNPNPAPPPVPPPLPSSTAPSNLQAVAIAAGRVDLTWRDNSRGEVGFKIERSLKGPNGPWTQIVVVGANATRWTNTGLPSATKVWYRIRAYGAFGNTDYSNIVVITTKSFGSTSGSTTSGSVFSQMGI